MAGLLDRRLWGFLPCVIPAKAGIEGAKSTGERDSSVPAFAGMTREMTILRHRSCPTKRQLARVPLFRAEWGHLRAVHWCGPRTDFMATLLPVRRYLEDLHARHKLNRT